MAQVNKELDTQRKQQLREAEKNSKKSESEEILAGLKKSKYALLKNEQDLNEQQILKLKQVKEVCPILGKMHELKEEIRQIFEAKCDWLEGLFKIGNWLSHADNYFSDSRKNIIRWLDEIIAYFDNRTTSGVVEGINNKLKLIKRSAYGFRSFDNFQTRCLLCWHFNC